MKKFALLTLSLCLSAALLVGCGCMNTKADVPTLPTNGEMTTPTTQMPATAPSSAPSTVPTTMATEAPTESTGPVEGAMDDIMGGSTDDATGNDATENGNRNRSRGTVIPRG